MAPDPDAEERIFADALRRADPADRAGFLAAACRDDAALKDRVEELLQAAGAAGGFLERRPDAGPGLEPGEVPGGPEGISGIHRYRVHEPLGEGGYGTVFRAEQIEPVRREVALKVIKPGMDSRSVVARFQAERHALARMDHPNIARVLDAGTVGAPGTVFEVSSPEVVILPGRPFVIMELVRGLPITAHCDAQRLTVTRRVELFIQVCQAVQHAHQKGIIHRDLKPSNILVAQTDGRTVPKVIDFGIAKAISGRLDGQTMFTQAEQFIGTPAYMSPEQAEPGRRDVDTRSDVYGLGAVLYELLAGRAPFDNQELLQGGLLQARRILLETDPPSPSARLGALAPAERATVAGARGTEFARLRDRLGGDLDWMVMKCLEKDPGRRYETANGLALDLGRHLRDEPVLAGPPRWSYRLGKGMRRHRIAVSVVSVIVLLLVAGIWASSWQALRATRAEREQREQARIASEARQASDEQRVRAERGEEEARGLLYFASMNRVRQAWDEGNLDTAWRMLQDVRTNAGRGFEWYYWHSRLREDLRTFAEHSGPVVGAEFLPDGRRVLSSDRDGHLLLWDAATGAVLASWSDPSGGISAMALEPGGAGVATAGRDGFVTLWNLEERSVRLKLRADSETVDCIVFSPDGRRILTAGIGTPIQAWDARSGNELGRFGEHMQPGPSVAFTPDGRRILTSELAALTLWDGQTLQRQERHQIVEVGPAVCWSPNGRVALLAESGPRVTLRSAASGLPLVTLGGHLAPVTCVRYSPDGRHILTGSKEGGMNYWQPNGQRIRSFKGHRASITSLAFSPNSRWFVSGSLDGTVKLWSAVVPKALALQPDRPRPAEWLRCLAVSADGKSVLTGDATGAVFLWDLATGRTIQTLAGHTDSVVAVAASPGGRWIATAGADSTARIWEYPSGREHQVLPGTAGRINAIAFSGNGTRIVTASESGIAELWEVDQAVASMRLRAGDAPLTAVACSREGSLVGTGDAEGAVAVWNATTGAPLWSGRRNGAVRALSFSPGGPLLFSGHQDGNGYGWDADSGAQRFRTSGHTDAIRSAAFSPDGRRILTAGPDATLRLWDGTSGRELLVLSDPPISGELAAFTHGGTRILANRLDRIHVWESASEEEVARWEAGETRRFSGPAVPEGGRVRGEVPASEMMARQTALRLKELRLESVKAARLARWDAATEPLREAIHRDPTQAEFWIQRSPLLVMIPDLPRYRRHRSEMLAAFAGTTNPLVACRIANSGLLLPVEDPTEQQILDRLVEVACSLPGPGPDPWQTDVIRGLNDYRKHQWDAAGARLERVVERRDLDGEDEVRESLVAQAHAVLAMTRLRQGREDEALRLLVEAEKRWIAELRYDYGEYWCERLLARIFNQEARRLIGAATRRPEDPAE